MKCKLLTEQIRRRTGLYFKSLPPQKQSAGVMNDVTRQNTLPWPQPSPANARRRETFQGKQLSAPTAGPTEYLHSDSQIACWQKTADFFRFATGTLLPPNS